MTARRQAPRKNQPTVAWLIWLSITSSCPVPSSSCPSRLHASTGSPLAALNMYPEKDGRDAAPCAGVIAGIGLADDGIDRADERGAAEHDRLVDQRLAVGHRVLLILGTFMETIAIILILAPVFVPILKVYQIDPVFFGVLLTVNLAIGANTPPLGIDLMAACRVGACDSSLLIGWAGQRNACLLTGD